MRLTQKDVAFLVGVTKHPEIMPFILDDGSDSECIEKISAHVLSSPNWVVLSPNRYSIFLYQQRNSILWEQHIQVLPEGREYGVEALYNACSWMFEHTNCLKIIGMTPQERAVRFVQKVGFEIEGKLSSSWLKNNELFDMTIVGLKKGELWLGYRQH